MMLSANQRRLAGPASRAFSNEVATASQSFSKASGVQTLWQYSAMQVQKAATKESQEAAYFNELKNFSTTPGAYTKLSETGSSKHLKKIRKQINAIVDQEIGLVEFKNKVNSEELAQNAYQEVVTKENFFFKVDEKKKERNMKVWNMKAPGNKFRKPQVILPHEHITPSHYIDIDGNDQD